MCICFHNGAQRQVGNLAAVGYVHIGHQIAQAQQGTHLLHPFLTGLIDRHFLLALVKPLAPGQTVLQIFLPPGYRGQLKAPGMCGFFILQIP